MTSTEQQLYPYQYEMYQEIPRRLAVYDSVLAQSPMRSGKSKVISATAERVCNRPGKVVLVLTHRGKIHKQLISHCNGISIDATTSHIFIQPGHCYVGMKQTLVNRPAIVSQLQALGRNLILIVDECHDGSFNSLIDQLYPGCLLIGFSATPVWKLSKHISKYYKQFIAGPQISELIKQGKFVPLDYFEMVSDLEGLKKQSTGEFTEESQNFVFGQAKLYDGLFTELDRFNFNKCAIFCASKKSADKLFLQFQDHQNPKWQPVVYYSGMKNYELAKFEELDQANVLITVRSLGTGWDYPPLDMCVLWCAMGSLSGFMQTAARPCTPIVGKPIVTELDFGGNNSRFGGTLTRQALTMDRDWDALRQPPEKPPKLSNGVAAIKNCPACDFIISAMARSCCNCGYIYPETDVILKEGELVKIEEGLAAERQNANILTGRSISTLTPAELAAYAKQRDKKSFAMRVAKAQTVALGADFAVQYEKAMGYKRGWSDRIIKEIAEIQMYEPDYKIPFADVIVK